MLSVTLAVMLRPRSAVPTAVLARAPTLVTPLPARTPPPRASDQGVSPLLNQGLEKAQQGALGEAAGLFKKALELRPTDVETWNNLGVVLVRQGQTAHGAEAFSHALRLDPDHREAHRNLAVTLDRQGRSREAVAHYQAFLRLAREGNPTREDVRRRLAEISASGNRASVSEPE